jgi:adenylyltransferase/sulfurtransferase
LDGQCTLVKGLIDYDQFCGVAPAPAADVVAEWEITPAQLKDKLDRGEEITIIDVREPHEWQIANLARYGARLIPLGQFPQRLNDINPADDIVVHCKVGGRSAQAYEVLQQAGYRPSKTSKAASWRGRIRWTAQCRSISMAQTSS